MRAQIVNCILGIWLMIAPEIFGTEGTAADNAHIVGPLIVSFAVISWWEATRVVRLYNLPLGVWLLLAPWVLGYDQTAPIVNNLVVGALVIALSLVKGKVEEKFGGGWSAIWKSDTPHAHEAKRQPRV